MIETIRYDLAYKLSDGELKKFNENVDHATIHRWSIKLWSPINQLAKVCHCIARKTLGWALLAFYTRYFTRYILG